MGHIPVQADARNHHPVFSPAVLLSSFFCIGYLPLIPGTFASLAVLGWFVLCKPSLPVTWTVAAAALAAGFLCAGRAEKILGRKDPRAIVIDEIAGMCLSLVFVPAGPWQPLAAFLVFRVLDTVKPFPADRLQDLGGAPGIMLDDIVAAAYTVLVMQAALRLIVMFPS